MRPQGSGTVFWERGRGWRARYVDPQSDRKVSVKVPRGDRQAKLKADERAAERVLNAELERVAESIEEGTIDMGQSLASLRDAWERKLHRSGNVSAKDDRSRWRFVEMAPFYHWSLDTIGPGHVQTWVNTLWRVRATRNGKELANTISEQTIKHALGLMKRAIDFGLIRYNLTCGNPAKLISVSVPEPDWTWHTVEQQRALLACAAVPAEARLRYAFAMGSMLRRAEWQGILLSDLDLDCDDPGVNVWRAAKNKAKRRQRVRVPLFGVALAAVRAWLPMLPSYCPNNRKGLLWPTERGAVRDDRAFHVHEHYAAAGIPTHPYTTAHPYHVLRHTGATSVVNALWNGRDEPHGRRWTLEEVRLQLGHRSVKTTERYAHLTTPGRVASGLVELVERIANDGEVNGDSGATAGRLGVGGVAAGGGAAQGDVLRGRRAERARVSKVAARRTDGRRLARLGEQQHGLARLQKARPGEEGETADPRGLRACMAKRGVVLGQLGPERVPCFRKLLISFVYKRPSKPTVSGSNPDGGATGIIEESASRRTSERDRPGTNGLATAAAQFRTAVATADPHSAQLADDLARAALAHAEAIRAAADAVLGAGDAWVVTKGLDLAELLHGEAAAPELRDAILRRSGR